MSENALLADCHCQHPTGGRCIFEVQGRRRSGSSGVVSDGSDVEADAALASSRPEPRGWAALADPAFVAALDEGLADVAAGRVAPYRPEPMDVERWIESLHENVHGLVWITKAELRSVLHDRLGDKV